VNVEHCGMSVSEVAAHEWCNAAAFSSQVLAAALSCWPSSRVVSLMDIRAR